MKEINSRRRFLKNTALAAAAFTIIPRHVLGGSSFLAPSDRLTKAIIGVGGMGRNHIPYGDTKLLAICDVDKNHLAEVLQMTDSDVRAYADYREVLQRPDIDIIHIATPPHWHGIMSAEAARAGKDVWCEKPMTRTIGEGMEVVRAVQQHGRIFRLNTWFRFDDVFYGFGTTVKPIKKLVDSKLLGWPLKVTINRTSPYACPC
jgi:myo-inositol 2-dehydrogenase/D-chiro-inositol 1-dehydrogenase